MQDGLPCKTPENQSPRIPHEYAQRRKFCPDELDGGEGGIRTHGKIAPTSDFESGAFNHSATSPIFSSNGFPTYPSFSRCKAAGPNFPEFCIIPTLQTANSSGMFPFYGRRGGMVDAADLKSAIREGVRVRVPSSVLARRRIMHAGQGLVKAGSSPRWHAATKAAAARARWLSWFFVVPGISAKVEAKPVGTNSGS